MSRIETSPKKSWLRHITSTGTEDLHRVKKTTASSGTELKSGYVTLTQSHVGPTPLVSRLSSESAAPWGAHNSYGVFTPEQDNNKTNVEPVHSYYPFQTRSDTPGVKDSIGIHRFNICLVVVLSSCSGVKTPLLEHFATRWRYRPTLLPSRRGFCGDAIICLKYHL